MNRNAHPPHVAHSSSALHLRRHISLTLDCEDYVALLRGPPLTTPGAWIGKLALNAGKAERRLPLAPAVSGPTFRKLSLSLKSGLAEALEQQTFTEGGDLHRALRGLLRQEGPTANVAPRSGSTDRTWECLLGPALLEGPEAVAWRLAAAGIGPSKGRAIPAGLRAVDVHGDWSSFTSWIATVRRGGGIPSTWQGRILVAAGVDPATATWWTERVKDGTSSGFELVLGVNPTTWARVRSRPGLLRRVRPLLCALAEGRSTGLVTLGTFMHRPGGLAIYLRYVSGT